MNRKAFPKNPDEYEYTPNRYEPEVYPRRIEWHLTYKCMLACKACTRACFLQEPYIENMTLEDAKECIRQAKAIGWQPDTITLTGGEPTLHPDFLGFVKLAKEWLELPHKGRNLIIYSNGFTEKARKICEIANEKYWASVNKDEWKKSDAFSEDDFDPRITPMFWDTNVYVSPEDGGIPFLGVCPAHSSWCCGLGVNHEGYSSCQIGINLSRLLGLGGIVTKNFADLFDKEKAREMTILPCLHCGFMFKHRRYVTHTATKKFEEYAKTCKKINGLRVSPTWERIFENRKFKERCKRWKK